MKMKMQLKGKMRHTIGIGILLAVVSAVLYGLLSRDGEAATPLVYLCLGIGIVLDLVILMLPPRKEILVTVTGWCAILITTLATALFVMERVQWLYALLSKMEVAPFTAMFPVTVILFVVTMIAQMAAMYFTDYKA